MTPEQRAWAITNEEVAAWWNDYTRQYPNSKASTVELQRSLAHWIALKTLTKYREN